MPTSTLLHLVTGARRTPTYAFDWLDDALAQRLDQASATQDAAGDLGHLVNHLFRHRFNLGIL
jgi:hypothetical protein